MKTKWSVFYSLLLLTFLASCGKEEFGTNPRSETPTTNPIKNYSHYACTERTLIKPKVDILYVVDNSESVVHYNTELKKAILNTVNTVSKQFDYRIVQAPLIPGDKPYEEYQVLSNSQAALPIPVNKIISAKELTFFKKPSGKTIPETGLQRTIDFINNTNGLFREDAYLMIVMVSNGFDNDVEDHDGQGNSEQLPAFGQRVSSFNTIKSSRNLLDLKFFSVAVKTNCKEEWHTSVNSYAAMADVFPGKSYDLCKDSVKNIFAEINQTIQQQVIPHEYEFWPVTFAENSDIVSIDQIRVTKVSPNGSTTTLTRGTDWEYVNLGSVQSKNTRALPTPGEPVVGKHFIQFTNFIKYPDCVQVTSNSKTEYFGFLVLPQAPKVNTIYLSINGKVIPQSSTNGWTYRGNTTVPNIKKPHPASPQGEIPAIPKSGFMLELNGVDNYYKTGDDVRVNYIPEGI